MRKLLLASTTLVLAASIGVAKAQNAPGTPPQTTQPSERGAMMHGMMSGEMREREMDEHSGESPMMMAHTTAAILHIRRYFDFH